MRAVHEAMLQQAARRLLQRQGTDLRLAELEALETASVEHALTRTMERLRSLLDHAFTEVPYYRELAQERGWLAEDFRVPSDLGELPLLTKRIIQDQGEALRARHGFLGPVKLNHTGGSTGEPLTFAQDAEYRAFGSADKLRLYQRCHYRFGQPLVFLWGSDYDAATHKTPWHRCFDRVGQNLIWVNTFALSEDLLADYAYQIARHDPVLIVGYVASLTLYARLLQSRDLPRPRPRALQASAEALTPADRQLLTEVFGCPVFDRYGCREVGIIAHECQQHHGLHASLGNNLVEVLDTNRRPVAPGQVGRVVVTNLRNRVQPFVRYEIGDLARVAEGTVHCPLTTTLLAEVVGRTTDNIVTPSGRILHGEFFTHLFYGAEGVRQFQVVQKSPTDLIIRVVPAPGADLKPLGVHLAEVIRQHGDPAFDVSFEMVDRIPTSASGKYRFTVSEVPSQW